MLFKKERKVRRTHLHKRKDYLLDENTPFDITEAFRNLKATISVSVPRKEKGGISLFATSAYPEDGKTTVTVNLGVMFAMSDAKVVVVDADIRKGRVAKYFKHHSAPGLSEYLSGQASLEDVLVQSKINENLYYIPCGTHSPKPYELLEGNAMKELAEKLKEKFDYIIYDTPPILVVSDAIAIAPVVDGAVLVSRHLVSYVNDIAKSLQSLQMAKINVLGVIVNDYTTEKINYTRGYKKYYYYSKHSYTYGYGPTAKEAIKEQKAAQEKKEENK